MTSSDTSESTRLSRTISAATSSASESLKWLITFAALSGLICMRTMATFWVPVRNVVGGATVVSVIPTAVRS